MSNTYATPTGIFTRARGAAATLLGPVLAVLLGLGQIAHAGPRVVVLWASLGSGHRATSESLRKHIHSRLPDAEVIDHDLQDFATPWRGRAVSLMRERIERLKPDLMDRWSRGYDELARTTPSMGDMPSVKQYDLVKLNQWLAAQAPTVVISAFAMATECLIKSRRLGLLAPEIPVAWLNTDYVDGPYHALLSRETDVSFVPHAAMSERFVDEFAIDPNRLIETGIPIDPAFAQIPTATELAHFARARGLDPRRPIVLMMSRGQSVGNLVAAVDSLFAADAGPVQVVAICSHDAGLRGKLERRRAKWASRVQLRTEGFVPPETIANYLRLASVFVSKAGGISSTQAFAVGVPTVLLDLIGAHERANIKLFERLGLALSTRSEGEVGPLIRHILSTPDVGPAMRERQRIFGQTQAPEKIVRWIERAACAGRLETL